MIAIVVVTALAGLALPAVVRPILRRTGAIDRPNERSSHSAPVIRGGGVVAAIVLVTSLATVGIVTGHAWLLLVAGATATSALLGLVDDVRGLTIAVRAGTQAGLGAAVGLVGLALGAPIIVCVVAALFFVVYVNATNFMDGVDGMSAVHGLVVGAAFATVGAVAAAPWLTWAGSLIAVSFVSFLPWNVLGSKMFLGDVGSYALGAAVVGTAFAGVADGVPWVAMLAPTSIYLLDTGLTLVRRIKRRERWYAAHRSHIYQRMTDVGVPHLVTSLVVGCLTALAGVGGVLIASSDDFVVSGLAIIASALAIYLVVDRTVARRLGRLT